MIAIDAAWRAAHPVPLPDGGDKNGRGQVLVIGGARRVPGAIKLTAEAALRVGAGRVRIATIASAALPIGIAMPEIGVIGLGEDANGDIAAADDAVLNRTLARVDTVVVGPGMGDRDGAAALIRSIAPRMASHAILILDGAAVACAGRLDDVLAPLAGRLIFTPHPGEMASLTSLPADTLDDDSAEDAAARFGAVVAFKRERTTIAAPGGGSLTYPGGGIGLATGGSGDVLAGAIAGLAARGAAPIVAAAWGVWLHGEAGRVLAARDGPIGFLARDLPPLLTTLLPR